MRGNDFVQVSYFSKIPFRYRLSSLLFSICLLVLITIFLDSLLTGGLQTLLLLLFFFALVQIIKKWIVSKREFNLSPFNKLKRFISANKLYEEETREVGANQNGNPRREKIVVNSAYFLYMVTDDELIIRAWKKADKFSDKANSYDTLLSALFGLELYKKYDDIQYCDYVFELVNDQRIVLGNESLTLLNSDVIQLTSKIKWELGKPPHALIVGGTGSGKTYLVNTLILDYLRKGAELFVADPKSADLALIGRLVNKEHTATTENEIAKLLREASDEMEKRYRKLFTDENSFGKTWKDFSGMKPLVVVIDEYAALSSVSSPKTLKEINSYLTSLILKGRQSGIEICMIMQRPDANILAGNLRDQFGVRIGLGNMTDEGRKMLFGSVDMKYKSVNEIGGGFVMIDGQHNAPVYFESPLVPKDFDFIEELRKIRDKNPDSTP
ncbi:FtsK/SpoIIIE domain-containing protein [Bacillus altitudinis]|uniref:FtsK/SpoIIIE domain-containing protein n=1 Tax=Bacillus pumilus TaxID=1408 RepID=UPI0025A23E14|nr:FtsK/SpoIIIE domain-containing protein [Bacillus pumilus]MDM5319021.1 FtsK/SpoIIIE domain-containing protein [Bacillus pumilus]MDR4994338.1 FtsK/SpoIIIE domain-containing protein [Bacillus altitudinis]